jgi:hypothetical protein
MSPWSRQDKTPNDFAPAASRRRWRSSQGRGRCSPSSCGEGADAGRESGASPRQARPAQHLEEAHKRSATDHTPTSGFRTVLRHNRPRYRQEQQRQSRPVKSRRVKRLALGLLAVPIALLCSACVASTGGSPDANPPAVESRTPSSEPTVTTGTPSSEPTDGATPQRETLTFGKSHTWDDGVSVTVGRPTKFKPSAYAVVEKSKRYLKFTVTVVNKSNKPINLGLTYIRVQSRNEEAHEVFDSMSGLRGPPDTKVLKRRDSEFDVGFGVADPKDLVLEIALHDNSVRPSLLYAT